ncbi:iron-sulfur protein [Streptomyces tanashiensis]|uniref:Cytochrome bc1 complex Rieske iron-sulfur subunit n=1 Tax=Streptomyces tanashiensis TaxID=67367 RepID=A0ABY6R572_9ACTN|nr:Rieske (2Fe-2S) protein [Streptomyces tanashiensis]UZX25205.1 Rieske (2Fe-2S) protein [Streptomyces tanashiensis]GGS97668.1 iron-sulfur protein [Streptomyces tanashiensis]GGY28701.1 iron-sulfur protein [Streptomyces tanashiensis]
MSGVARRTVVAAAGSAGLAAALAACGGGADDKNAAPEGTPLARTGDIPVGGGKILADKGLVITQPKAGEFKAFSSKCTHAGCAVSSIKDGVIVCPCHQSQFDVSDGSVKSGPATAPLPPEPIQVVGEEISLG